MKSYHIAAAQSGNPANNGRVYYKTITSFISVGEGEEFTISSQAGGEGQVYTDDVVLIAIKEQDTNDKPVYYKYDYSNGCSGRITPTDPVNLNQQNAQFNQFQGKTVNVIVTFSDKCGGVEGCSDYFLNIG